MIDASDRYDSRCRSSNQDIESYMVLSTFLSHDSCVSGLHASKVILSGTESCGGNRRRVATLEAVRPLAF